MSNFVACVGDTSSHGGEIISAGTSIVFLANGDQVCVHGAVLDCPEHGHVAIAGNATIGKIGGVVIVKEGALASCGAVIQPPNRNIEIK